MLQTFNNRTQVSVCDVSNPIHRKWIATKVDLLNSSHFVACDMRPQMFCLMHEYFSSKERELVLKRKAKGTLEQLLNTVGSPKTMCSSIFSMTFNSIIQRMLVQFTLLGSNFM